MALKASDFVVGIILIGLIAGVFGLFIGEVNSKYGTPYNTASIESYDKLNELSLQADELRNSTQIHEKQGVLDVIGSYFSDAYNGLIITQKSFDAYDSMTSQAANDLKLGSAGKIIRLSLGLIVMVLIFLAVFISAALKKDV